MASPFTMGLSGLASRNVASYVRTLEICGEWKEHEVEEHVKMGRVPDESMLLNTLVRVAVEKMAVLDSFRYLLHVTYQLRPLLTFFRWELNLKMLPTLWHGIALSQSLTKLTVKCPSNRCPKPITLVPPIPNLEYLHLFDIDPLCYADDISSLLLGSKKLRHLKMHWSPRMREAREPSIHQSAFFGRCAAAHYAVTLKSMALQNLYTHHDNACDDVFDLSQLEDITFLNSAGGINDNGPTAFLDAANHAWRYNDKFVPNTIKSLRCDKASRHQCEFLAHISNLEKLYLINPHTQTNRGSATTFPNSPASSISSPSNQDTNNILSLKEDYLEAITKSHGATLKHLLLLPQWRLTNDDIAILVRRCPNLEQLGIGVEFSSFGHMRLLVPFLPRLRVIRLLGNPDDPMFVNRMREMDENGFHEKKISEDTVNEEWNQLRYMEIGAPDMIFEMGKRQVKTRDETTQQGKSTKETFERSVKRRILEDVKDIDIWKFDSPDI